MPPRSRPAARGIVALAAVAVGACGTSPIVPPGFRPSPSSSAGSTSSSTSTSTGSSSTAIGASSITFGRCSGASVPRRAVCGTLQVPLDYSDSSKGTIVIPVVKVPATDPTQRIGSLLVNPGGPGASGVQFVEEALASTFVTLNRRFDIVGFDPRGIGGPDVIACLTPTQFDEVVAADPIVDDPAEKQTMIDTNKLLATSCQDKVGRLLPYVGTDNVARDLDALRAALGDDKLSYLGFSYGTDIGSHYAQMFPTHIRAMVLDGDVDTSIPFIAAVEQQADSLANSYQEFLRRCTARAACPMGSDPGGAINRLLSSLDTTPIRGPDGRLIGRGEGLVALLGSMYDATVWNEIYILFGRAITSGDVAGLELLLDTYTGRGQDHRLESGPAVDCVDDSVPTDIATYDAEAAKTEARDPYFGDSAVYGVLPCAYWPVHGSPAKPVNVTGAPTIVLVGATNDPATPYTWSQSLQKQIHGSVLLTRDGYGHTSYDFSTCIAGHVDAYLNDLTIPAAGITCPSN